jgi:hypothetical protein
MGTRAAFFIGDFRDPEKREWLGCIAWDGYPAGVPGIVQAKSEADFRQAVADLSNRNDFAPPTGPFPFPWENDLCLTDCTYTWHDGEVWTEFDRRFVPLERALEVWNSEDDERDSKEIILKRDFPTRDCDNIPAPGKPYDGTAPDSIIILAAKY